MTEDHCEITTSDGVMNSFVVHPDEGGPFPVVLFYMDAPGKREELHDMARRIAAVGYFVVLPSLYYRRSPDYVLRERTEAAPCANMTCCTDPREISEQRGRYDQQPTSQGDDVRRQEHDRSGRSARSPQGD